MKSLVDLFGQDKLKKCKDKAPIPRGRYICEAVKSERKENKNGTPEFLVTWKVVEGDCEGKYVFQNLYLTDNALYQTIKALEKLGISEFDDLYAADVSGTRAELDVVLKTADSGNQSNDVKGFTVLQPKQENPFPPKPSTPTPEAAPITNADDDMVIENTDFYNDLLAMTPTEEPPIVHASDEYPEYVKTVFEAIDGVMTAEEIHGATKLNMTWIQQSLEQLKELGLKCKQVRGTYVWWWEGERPTIKTYPHEPEMTIEEFEKGIKGVK